MEALAIIRPFYSVISMNIKKAHYGIDAPPVVRNLLIWAAVNFLIGFFTFRYLPGNFSIFIAIFSFLGSAVCLAEMVYMIYSSKKGKKKVIETIIDDLKLSGSEYVLDVGCGSGMMLVETAKRLDKGKAIGIDIWQKKDQSNNSIGFALSNLHVENVHSRTELLTADMREMPFHDGAFDAAISCLAIHNLPRQEERLKSIQEIDRVVKPGGKIALIDFQHIEETKSALLELGWENVKVSKRHFSMFPPVKLIRGTKPHP